jgi:hypothetical protein
MESEKIALNRSEKYETFRINIFYAKQIDPSS